MEGFRWREELLPPLVFRSDWWSGSSAGGWWGRSLWTMLSPLLRDSFSDSSSRCVSLKVIMISSCSLCGESGEKEEGERERIKSPLYYDCWNVTIIAESAHNRESVSSSWCTHVGSDYSQLVSGRQLQLTQHTILYTYVTRRFDLKFVCKGISSWGTKASQRKRKNSRLREGHWEAQAFISFWDFTKENRLKGLQRARKGR